MRLTTTPQRFLMPGIAGALCISLLAACGGGDAAADTTDVKVHGDLPGPFWMSEVVATSLEELSPEDDGLDAKFYPAAALGIKGDQILDPLAEGQVDLAQISVGFLTGEVPYLGVGELPMLAQSTEDARKIMDATTPIVAEALEEQHGVKILGYGVSTPVHLFMRDTEYRGLESLEGMRLRIPSAVTEPWVEALGATGKTFPAPELPEAMSTNQLDGAFNSLAGNLIFELNQWGSNVLMTSASVAPVIFAVGSDTWQDFTPEQQEALQDVADTMTDAWFEQAAEQELEAIKSSEEAGYQLIELPDADRAALEEKARLAWDAWVKRIDGDLGQRILDAALDATAS